MSVVQETAEGLEILSDWLGAGGKPVSPEQAEQRARACAQGDNGKPCTFNCAPKWWEYAKLAVAHWITKELEAKNKMGLSVPNESEIHMCSRCGCCLPLKVWTPIDHIRAHLHFDSVQTYPDHCWIKREIKS